MHFEEIQREHGFSMELFWNTQEGTNRKRQPAVEICREWRQLPQLTASVLKMLVSQLLLRLLKQSKQFKICSEVKLMSAQRSES